MRWVKCTQVVLILALILGCVQVRKSLVDLSESDLKNAETTRTVAKNLLSTWQLNSGFIRGAIGPRMDEMPAQVITAFNELDELSKKVDRLSDYELGYSLGLRVRMLSAIVQEAIRQYAPEIIRYVPSLFGL